MSNIINASTKRLVWLIARPNHADHAAAVTEATRRVEKGAKAAAKLEEALTRPSTAQAAPTVKASARIVQSPSAPKGSSKAPISTKKAAPAKVTTRTAHTKVEDTPFQTEVKADPDTYGVGFGPKRVQRGLPKLTAEQRAARKDLHLILTDPEVAAAVEFLTAVAEAEKV